MTEKFMTAEEAFDIVGEYMKREGPIVPLQEILDSGAIPRLKGYIVRPGKVSDSIFGGKGSFLDKSTGKDVEFENAPFVTKSGLLFVPEGIDIRGMVRTERISTHDINRGSIPFKAQILAENHNYMRRLLAEALGTSQWEVIGLEDKDVVIAAENLEQIGFENVLRGYMAKSSTTTSLYQHFIKGDREYCGHKLPENLITNGKLPYVMDTPSTKSDEHDISVAPEKLFEMGVCTPDQYNQLRNATIFAFGVVSEYMRQRGLIAVDTKTEHGVTHDGRIVSQDEIWTMDSSRFWLADDYADQMQKLKAGEIEELAPRSYSKEFARGFSKGEEGYTDEQRAKIAVRYIEGAQQLLGKRFEPDMRSREEKVVTGLQAIVDNVAA